MEWIVIGLAAWVVVAVGGCFLLGAAIRAAERSEAARRRPAWAPRTDQVRASRDRSTPALGPDTPPRESRRDV